MTGEQAAALFDAGVAAAQDAPPLSPEQREALRRLLAEDVAPT